MADQTPASMNLAKVLYDHKGIFVSDKYLADSARALDDAGVRVTFEELTAARRLMTNTCNSGWRVLDANQLIKRIDSALSALTGENQQEGSDG